ncbi:MAG TPA: hypothetical protein ENF80_01165 [Thermofilum sp.]|nr:hypothetical protein [Thermofilum sp.]
MRRRVLYCGALLGLLYVIYGVLQVYNGVVSWWFGSDKLMQLGVKVFETHVPNTFPDPFSGLTLITIGLLFLAALYHSMRGFTRYKGYLFAAWLLAVTVLVLNVVEICASFLDAYYPLLYGGTPNFEWSLAVDAWGIAPHLLLGVLALPLYFDLKDFIRELIPGL